MKIQLLIQRQEDLKQHLEHLLVTLSQEVAVAVVSMVAMLKIVVHLQDLVVDNLEEVLIEELEMVLHSQEQLALLQQMVGVMMVVVLLKLATKALVEVEQVVLAVMQQVQHLELILQAMVVQVSKFQQHSDILPFL